MQLIARFSGMRFIQFIFVLAISIGIHAQEKPIVVVELFTSEGCSSCPPADRLLSSIVKSENDDVEVLGLSFHVDYWDYIGWKDPYASRDFTIRQRAYARRFGLNSIYTPQMVVNGKHEFVGSSRSQWVQSFQVEKRYTHDLKLEVSIIELSSEDITVTIKSDETNSLVNVAVVETGLSQDVKRGENRGRRLTHDNVVRAFDTRTFDGSENTFKLNLPEDLNLENASLIVYSQQNNSWKVNGAKRLSLAKN